MNPDTVTRPPTDDDRSETATIVELWFGATAWCGDTRVGTVCGFVCSSPSPHLHDVVVRGDARPHAEHPIALRDIGGTDRHDIAVDLPAEAVDAHAFITDTVIVDDREQTWWTDLDTGAPDPWLLQRDLLHIPVTVPRLAPGDILVREHAAVHVEHHHVGRLAGFRVDRTSQRVTGCIVDVGHRWHHRHVLVPATAIEELSDMVVRVRGPLQEISHMSTPRDPAPADLTPGQPDDVGVDDGDPDAAHTEAAHLLADEAHDVLRGRGFTNSEIRHWADAYVQAEHSGDPDDFLAWINTREHGRRP